MGRFIEKFSIVFTAGAFGGIVNALCAWFFGRFGLAAALGAEIAPAFNEQYIYPKIFWGGVWGILFLLPFMKKSYFVRAIIYSIAPSLIMLFVVFPYWLKKGVMGLELGTGVPFLVFLYNFFWGIATALWIRIIEKKQAGK